MPAAKSTSTAHEVYSPTARAFHWVTFALLAVQIPIGLFMVWYGETSKFAPPTAQLYDAHKLIGLLIMLLVIARLAYRLSRGAPGDEPTLEPWQRVVSHVTHWLIYLALLVVPLLGWLAVSAYGPVAPFGIKLPALLAQNDAQATILFDRHRVAAFVLIALIGMHVGAALFHYVIRKDGVLNRMLPMLPRRDGA